MEHTVSLMEALCGNGSLWIHFIKVTNILNKMKLVGATDRKCYSFNHKMFVSVDSNFTCIIEINKNVPTVFVKYSSI